MTEIIAFIFGYVVSFFGVIFETLSFTFNGFRVSLGGLLFVVIVVSFIVGAFWERRFKP